MVQTRSRTTGTMGNAKGLATKSPKERESKGSHKTPTKRKVEESHVKSRENDSRPSKQAKKHHDEEGNHTPASEDAEAQKKLLDRVIADYGDAPLNGQVDESSPPSNVVMAHLLNALVASARISHTIAARTLQALLKARYHDMDVLRATSWDQRVQVFIKGGYTRYREKTATYLGDLIELMADEYDNDVSRMLPQDSRGEEARRILSERLQQVKGLGPVGADIFLGSIQHFFPNVSPFLDKRSRETAKTIGLGSDVGRIFQALNEDTMKMTKLEVGLTKVRLEKKESEVTGQT